MVKKEPSAINNWGMFLIYKILYPFVIFVTPLFVLFLMIYFVSKAFISGLYPGIRSFSGILIPLITVTFIFIFQKELLEKLGKIHTLISFFGSLIAGIIVMKIISILPYSSAIPFTELVLSCSFSVLVFSYVSFKGNKMLSYYFGMVSGFLIYIFFWGFPVLR